MSDVQCTPTADEFASAVLEVVQATDDGKALTWGDVVGWRRSPAALLARRLLVHALRLETMMSYPEIAGFVRGSCAKHASVHDIHAKAARLFADDGTFRDMSVAVRLKARAMADRRLGKWGVA